MACILQMVPGWKNSTKLRVFVTDVFDNMDFLFQKWQRRLKLLRIDCNLQMVNWCENSLGPSVIDLHTSSSQEKDRYFTSVNQFIHSNSEHSNLIFLYLPAPNIIMKENDDYLQRLTTMTQNCPPTILVHGITEVTSDSL